MSPAPPEPISPGRAEPVTPGPAGPVTPVRAEPITPVPPRPVRRVTMTQVWRDLAFVHWSIAPDVAARLLPGRVRPDVLNGTTYVGLVPFRIRLGLLQAPALPYIGYFLETNVRLYSVDADGRRGLVFLSLDASRLLPVLGARSGYRLPYFWSDIELERRGGLFTYRCRRRWPQERAVSRLVLRAGGPLAERTALEEFVTARWGMHSEWRGRTIYTPLVHERWPLHRAEIAEISDDLVTAAGLPAPTGKPVSVLWSPGVSARFGPPIVV